MSFFNLRNMIKAAPLAFAALFLAPKIEKTPVVADAAQHQVVDAVSAKGTQIAKTQNTKTPQGYTYTFGGFGPSAAHAAPAGRGGSSDSSGGGCGGGCGGDKSGPSSNGSSVQCSVDQVKVQRTYGSGWFTSIVNECVAKDKAPKATTPAVAKPAANCTTEADRRAEATAARRGGRVSTCPTVPAKPVSATRAFEQAEPAGVVGVGDTFKICASRAKKRCQTGIVDAIQRRADGRYAVTWHKAGETKRHHNVYRNTPCNG